MVVCREFHNLKAVDFFQAMGIEVDAKMLCQISQIYN